VGAGWKHGAAKGKGHGGPAKGASLWGGARGAKDDKGAPLVTGYDPVRHADRVASAARGKVVKEKWAELHRKVAERLERDLDEDRLEPRDVISAFTATGNRAYGQPKQPVEQSGPDGGPMQTKIEIEIKYADDPDGGSPQAPAGAAGAD